MGVDLPVVPEDSGFEGTYGLIEVAASEVNLAEDQIALRAHRLACEHTPQCRHRLVIIAVLKLRPRVGEQILCFADSGRGRRQ